MVPDTKLDRRSVVTGGALAAASALCGFPAVARADKSTVRLKFGNDLPAAHPVNVRLREAIATISAETLGAVRIELFPNNQLGGDPSMLSQIRSGALELATFRARSSPRSCRSWRYPVLALPIRIMPPSGLRWMVHSAIICGAS